MDSLSEFVSDDELAVPPLAAERVVVRSVSWRDAKAKWDDFDLVVVRSTWDYQQEPARFFEVLADIDQSRARLANPLSLMQWNVEKTYLRDLQMRGVPTIPTLYGETLDAARWEDLQGRFHDRRWVLKPVIGANADHAWLLDGANPPSSTARLLETYRQRAWMAQPFIESIVEVGEISLFYFAGRYSHAVRKRPRVGDFRVQEEHGGKITTIEPPPDCRLVANRTLSHLPTETLYARIDLVAGDDGPLIMEVELIEPSLYLRMDAQAPRRFAEAVVSWLKGGGRPSGGSGLRI